jgi:hypothetical protein
VVERRKKCEKKRKRERERERERVKPHALSADLHEQSAEKKVRQHNSEKEDQKYN